jgi:hypothetical protein
MDFFQKSPVLAFPLIALGLFMLIFFVITLKTVMTQKSRYEALARLPLSDGEARSTKEASRE